MSYHTERLKKDGRCVCRNASLLYGSYYCANDSTCRKEEDKNMGYVDHEYPAANYQNLVGKRIAEVLDTTEADEGLKIVFDDGSWFEFLFSGCEGTIEPLIEKQKAG